MMVLARRVLLPLAVVILATVASLGGAAWNRSAAESTIVLTERELALPFFFTQSDDSGLALRLLWQRGYDLPDEEGAALFDPARLCAIGFDCGAPAFDDPGRERAGRRLSRPAFVVLEYDGPIGQQRQAQRLERLKKNVSQPSRGEESVLAEPRLEPIDIGRDAAALRVRYSDGARYLILPGVVRMSVTMVQGKPRWTGFVSELFPESINVPRDQRALFDTLIASDRSRRGEANPSRRPPRYAVTLKVGRRLEPWIESVRRLQQE